MTVILVHNFYQQPGGEDEVFRAESSLLKAHGHEVFEYTLHNDNIVAMSRAKLAINTIWNASVHHELGVLVRRLRPDVVHFHNTFPLVSPAAFAAVKAEGVPVVVTLHNYRLLCPNALFFRDGHTCEDCLGKVVPWPGVLHACYRGTRGASAVVAGMLTVHRLLRTWTQDVDLYIALTEFARQKFVEGGLPEERVTIKPNFVFQDPGMGLHDGGYILFVGRLVPEKGISTLLASCRALGDSVRLKIVGDGPLGLPLRGTEPPNTAVEWLGQRSHDEVIGLMKAAVALIVPSVWYEGFGLVIAEAFAVGLPVIASDLGGMSSLIRQGRTGLLFRAGDGVDLATQIRWMFDHPEESAAMRREARLEYEKKFTSEENYRMLAAAYRLARQVPAGV